MLNVISIEKYAELVNYVQNNCPFYYHMKVDNAINPRGLGIKYISCTYDTRHKGVWEIKLVGFGLCIKFSTLVFIDTGHNIPDDFPYKNLFDWVIGYLTGEWNDPELINKITSVEYAQ